VSRNQTILVFFVIALVFVGALAGLDYHALQALR
jgi:hypothetical protein